MAYNVDGNMLALNAYQREQDALADGEEYLESLQQELANDLFDAYVSNNHAVIDEVDDALTDTDTTDNLITRLREAMTKECERPVMGRGVLIYEAYMKIISDKCEAIAKRCSTPHEFDKFKVEYGL